MARLPGRTIALTAAALVLAATFSWTLRLADEAERLPALQHFPRQRTLVLLAGAALSLLLFLLFRATAAAFRRRGQEHALPSLRTFEMLVAFLLVALVAIASAGGLGTALVSAGLAGAALTLALQRPILSIAGWAAIRFGRLFREGDRIEVDGIVGDVIEIRLISTSIWEIGSNSSPLPWGGAVSPLRPTGRIVHVGNATFFEKPVANATVHLPYTFDEFVVTVAYEADWRLARQLLHTVAQRVIDPVVHAEAAARYDALMTGVPGTPEFPREPAVILSLQDSWIELRLRYLVDTHRRSMVRTQLAEAWQEAVEPHADRLPNVYPRSQPMPLAADGRAQVSRAP